MVDAPSDYSVLKFVLQKVNLSLEDVQSEMEDMNNKAYLNKHSYEIWQGEDGRWRTYLPDEGKKTGRRLVAKSTEEKLEKAIIDYYKAIDDVERQKRSRSEHGIRHGLITKSYKLGLVCIFGVSGVIGIITTKQMI